MAFHKANAIANSYDLGELGGTLNALRDVCLIRRNQIATAQIAARGTDQYGALAARLALIAELDDTAWNASVALTMNKKFNSFWSVDTAGKIARQALTELVADPHSAKFAETARQMLFALDALIRAYNARQDALEDAPTNARQDAR